MILKNELASRIKARAAAIDISISSLEHQAGYSPGMFSRWLASEKEDFNVLTKLEKVADILGMTMDELLGRSQKVGTSEKSGNIVSNDPILYLTKATSNRTVTWSKLAAEDELQLQLDQIPTSKHDLSYSSAWWVRTADTYLLLVAYCDDATDLTQSLELSLYCVVGHGLPLAPVLCDDEESLYSLFGQVCIWQAFHSIGFETQK